MLWEFVQKRLKELGMMVAQLTDDFDIMPTTVQRIRDGRVIKESTKQKLALALKCSVGEINDAIAGRQNQENAEGPSVMEAVDKPEQMARASEEEPAGPEKPKREKLVHPYTEMQRAEEARRKESQPKERWPKDDTDAKLYSMAARWKLENETKPGQKDEVMYSERELDEICKKKINEYKQQLKDLSLKTFARVPQLNVSGETPYGLVGRALMEKLLEDEAEAEQHERE